MEISDDKCNGIPIFRYDNSAFSSAQDKDI